MYIDLVKKKTQFIHDLGEGGGTPFASLERCLGLVEPFDCKHVVVLSMINVRHTGVLKKSIMFDLWMCDSCEGLCSSLFYMRAHQHIPANFDPLIRSQSPVPKGQLAAPCPDQDKHGRILTSMKLELYTTNTYLTCVFDVLLFSPPTRKQMTIHYYIQLQSPDLPSGL